MSIENAGGCVCGQLRYVTRGEPQRVTVCHCTWCQRRTGTAFGIQAVFRQDQFWIVSGSVSSYRHTSDESGRWLEQQFCAKCGTNIGLTLEAVPGIQGVSAGTFDDPSWIRSEKYPFRHVYLRSAQGWSVVPDGVAKYEEHFRS